MGISEINLGVPGSIFLLGIDANAADIRTTL